MEKINISAISYLNTRPFVYGLQCSEKKDQMCISFDTPAVCTEKLRTGQAHIGLVPVAALSTLPGHRVISDFCIGSEGEVKSVGLFSDVPLGEISTVVLDYQSRTSVVLARLLAEKLWKITPEWEQGAEGYEKLLGGTEAGVIIGDRALQLRECFPYVYDLAGEWKKLTGLPFVFACWVAVRELPGGFEKDFNEALSYGVAHLRESVQGKLYREHLLVDPVEYLEKNISFSLDENKKKAMKLFLEMVKAIDAKKNHHLA